MADRQLLCVEICPSSSPVILNTENKHTLINWHKNVTDRFKVCGIWRSVDEEIECEEVEGDG